MKQGGVGGATRGCLATARKALLGCALVLLLLMAGCAPLRQSYREEMRGLSGWWGNAGRAQQSETFSLHSFAVGWQEEVRRWHPIRDSMRGFWEDFDVMIGAR
ncbi:MAG: hypothetical protein ACE5GW_03445 [Planctomycetota bacterium]